MNRFRNTFRRFLPQAFGGSTKPLNNIHVTTSAVKQQVQQHSSLDKEVDTYSLIDNEQKEQLRDVVERLTSIPTTSNNEKLKPVIWNDLVVGKTSEEIHNIGQAYFDGDGVNVDRCVATNMWKYAWDEFESANSGYSYALMLVNNSAPSIPADPTRARSILSIVAQKGHPYAQYDLAALYKDGTGGPVDLTEAFHLYHLAAQNGIRPAMRAVADAYLQGAGVTRDFELAAKFYKTSAEFGDPLASFNLGLLYMEGKGVEADPELAVKYTQIAARDGILLARYQLGVLYEGRYGVREDYKLAAKHYKVAAEKGLGAAAINLGHIYRDGKGVKVSLTMAKVYYELAAEHTDYASIAQDLLDQLNKK